MMTVIVYVSIHGIWNFMCCVCIYRCMPETNCQTFTIITIYTSNYTHISNIFGSSIMSMPTSYIHISIRSCEYKTHIYIGQMSEIYQHDTLPDDSTNCIPVLSESIRILTCWIYSFRGSNSKVSRYLDRSDCRQCIGNNSIGDYWYRCI